MEKDGKPEPTEESQPDFRLMARLVVPELRRMLAEKKKDEENKR